MTTDRAFTIGIVWALLARSVAPALCRYCPAFAVGPATSPGHM